MKKCNECFIEKDESEFYKSLSNRDRLENKCKKCRFKQISKLGNRKYPVKNDGKRTCKICGLEKDINDFSINRHFKTGRQNACRVCLSNRDKKRRRVNGIMYLPVDGYVADGMIYFTGKCEVCDRVFDKIRPSHKRCKRCTRLVLDILSHLNYSRKGKYHIRCNIKEAIQISKLFISSEKCCYCNRIYTTNNIKSIDHILPVSRGGLSNIENINICCLECNLFKRELLLNDWIDLCRSISSFNKEDNSLKQKIFKEEKIIDGNCLICSNSLKKRKYSKELSSICKDCIEILSIIRKNFNRKNNKGETLGINISDCIFITKLFLISHNCCYCNSFFSKDNIKSLDHIIPISKGGTNTAENANICCLRCNLSKRNLLLDDWIELCKCINNNSALQALYGKKKQIIRK